MRETVIVRNTETGELGKLPRKWFESPVLNPNGLLVLAEDCRSGCTDCGIEPVEIETAPEEPELQEDED